MNVTGAAIKRNRVTSVAIAVLVLAGLNAYQHMPSQLDPGFIIRAAQVVTIFPGASPERVEQLVTNRIEKAVQEIPELDFVQSNSKTGLSVVVVNVKERYTEMRPIWDRLRRKVEKIEDELPEGVIGPDINDEFGDTFGILMTIVGDGITYRELEDAADEVRDELLRLGDVAKVEIHGAQEERVFVEYRNARLAQLGLSPASLGQILETRNIIMPGGHVELESEKIVLEPTGSFASVEELRHTLIPLPGGAGVAELGDVVQVRRDYVDPPSEQLRANGERALMLAVSLREGGNLVELGGEVRALYQRLPELYPHGYEFDLAFFEPDTVGKKVDDFVGNVLQSVGIVLAVMLLTLGLRTGTIVATLIPTAMVVSLLVMSVFEIWIDQISLAALIISLGLLVDNAIVMSESIMVRIADGEERFEAAVGAARELTVPLLTSSLTTAAAFLPIYLAESNTGEYTAPLFKVVAITLLVSWALALTMTPLLCVRFLEVQPQGDRFDRPFYRGYRALLGLILRNRLISGALVIAVFYGSLQLFALIPNIFFPPTDRAFIVADFDLPPGTPFSRSAEVTERIDRFIGAELRATDGGEGVAGWTTFVGGRPPRYVLSANPAPPESHLSSMMINTSSHAAVAGVIERLARFAADELPDVQAHVRALGNGPPVTKPVQVRISGGETERIFAIADQVKARLEGIAGTRNVSDDWGGRVKKFVVRVDQDRARRAGISNLDVAVSLQTFLSGMQVTSYREGENVIPVVMRSGAADRTDLDRLETLNVFSQLSGQSVPLRQVAEVDLEFQPSVIKRRDRSKVVTVEAELASGVTALEVVQALTPWLDAQSQTWGRGYRYELGGEVESSLKANASIGAKVPIAALTILLLLVWQFNSLRKPAIILATIPLAMIGVLVGLLVMRSYFGFMTLLGVISLAGIVINNAIVLLDRIELEIEDNGRAPHDAIIQAAQSRLRPILLTTATTVASLIPLYVGGGVMFEPMAVAIMFGLVFSTALTLGVVPLLYSALYRVEPS